MIAPTQVRRVVRDLARFNLSGPERIDDAFIERVRVAHHWAMTHRGRWRNFTHASVYNLRHHYTYETGRPIDTKAFAVASVLAGWNIVRCSVLPGIFRFRRAQAEA
jgi:hypothetical protein